MPTAESVITHLMSVICAASVPALSSWLMGMWVFAPLYQPTFLFRVNGRFRISDLIILAALSQLGLGIAMAIGSTSRNPAQVQTSLIGFVWIILLAWWLAGIRMLARGGIENTRDRWLCLGLIIPLGYACSLVFLCLAVTLPLVVTVVLSPNTNQSLAAAAYLLFHLGLGFGCFALLRYVRAVTNQIVLRARESQSVKDGIYFGRVNEQERLRQQGQPGILFIDKTSY